MIKKQFLFASLAAFGLALGACSDELDNQVATGTDGTVTFTAQLPEGLASRADVTFNQGEKATNLSYAVYKSGSTDVIFSSEDAAAPTANYDATTKSFTLSLNLVKGQTYDFVFWADADNSPYTFDPATQSVAISYDDVEGNDDTRDAFFTSISALNVTGAMQKNVELRRPFAQLNIGTDDIDAAKLAKIEHGTTTVTVKDVYSTLNIFDGTATDPQTVTFAAHPANEVAFPVTHADAAKAYTHLSMNYILTGTVMLDGDVNKAQKETKDLSIAFADADGSAINSFELSAVPFQRNYRTNIYGSLLTSQVDFTIEVVPGFEEEPGHGVEVIDVWDGQSVDEPTEYKELYEVATAAELVGIAKYATENPTQVINVELQSDIDLGGFKFEGFNPRDPNPQRPGYALTNPPQTVNFDGKGHTIRNFVTREEGETQYRYAEAGLFGVINGTVKDLVIEDAIVGSVVDGVVYGNIAGVLAGYVMNHSKIENVTVRNSTVYGYAKVGGLVGYDYAQGSSYTNCTVENVKIYGVYNTAYMIGFVGNDDITINGCQLIDNSFEFAPHPDNKPVMIENIIAYDSNVKGKQDRPARMLNGKYVPFEEKAGYCYYATEAVYYNRFDVYNYSIGYRMMYNGEDVEIDGYQVNELGKSNIVEGIPAGAKPVVAADGTVYDGIWVSADATEYSVVAAAGMQSLAAMVNGAQNLSGKTILLTEDLDMTGINWEPIGAINTKPFSGTFDGQGHTIANLYMADNADKGHTYVGLFGLVSNGNVKNVNLLDAKFENIKCKTGIGAIAGGMYPGGLVENCTVDGLYISGNRRIGGISGYNYGSIKNCKVSNFEIAMQFDYSNGTTVDNADKAGGIAGYLTDGSYTCVNCTATNGKITAFRHLGGIVGYTGGNTKVAGCTASNIDLYYLTIPEGCAYAETDKVNSYMGEIAGYIGNNNVDASCTAENVTLHQ